MEEPPEGPFRWSDLKSLGITEFTLRRWLQEGCVRRVLTGVYLGAGTPDSTETRAQCTALVIPSDAVVCDRTAAWLWNVDVLDPDERFAVPDVEVAVAPGQVRLRRRGVHGVERDLEPAEVTMSHGVHLTTPVRTAIDLACRRGRWQALATLDVFMRTFGLTHADLAAALCRYAGRRGVSQARELAPLATPLAESPGESWTRCAILDDGLPAPEPQIEIFIDGVLRAKLDLGYRHLRVAVEYDGEEFHGASQREHDETRRTWIREQGWHVIVVRKNQLRGLALQEWLDELGRVLADRTDHGKVRYARRPEPWVTL